MATRRGGMRASGKHGHGTQPNAPFSTNLHSGTSGSVETQVAVHTQQASTEPTTDLESTSNPRVRGITCGQGARKAVITAKARMTVEFNFNIRKAICNNAETFNNEIGYIVRKNCSLRYKDWRHVPHSVRAPLRQKLLTLFDIDVEDEQVQLVIDDQMHNAWKNYKYELHRYYKKIGGVRDPIKAKNIGHEDVSKENWDYLCDMWSTDKFKEHAKKCVVARSKKKGESRNGSRSTARHHVGRGADLDAPTGQIETWRLRHWNAEKGWTSTEKEAEYEKMMKLRRDNPAETMTDKVIMEKVLGRKSNRLSGWMRSPSKSRGQRSQDSTRASYNQIVSELNEYKSRQQVLEDKFQNMQRILIENDILPHSSIPQASPSERPGPSTTVSPGADHDYDSDSDSYSDAIL